MLYYFSIFIMTFLGSLASFFLKKASSSAYISALLKNRNLYIGGVLYVISALINIYVLKFLPYSVVLPLTSLTYIWTMVFSYFYLKEKVNNKKVIGVFIILFGAILVAV